MRLNINTWPDYLQPYVAYIMRVVRKYIGEEKTKKCAYKVESPLLLTAVSFSSKEYLSKITTNDEDAFLLAINSIMDEFLGLL